MTRNAKEPPLHDARVRILSAAAELIRRHGPDAATTRAVASAARVQPPTIYRLIGDKDALLDAVAEHVLHAYVAHKKNDAVPSNPVAAARVGWDRQVAFGLANPGLFRIMSSNANSPAYRAGREALKERIDAIAAAGRLRGSVERAAALVHATCVGTILTLIAHENASDYGDLSSDAREAALSAITHDSMDRTDDGLRGAANMLRSSLGQVRILTPGEQGLLNELLARIGNNA